MDKKDWRFEVMMAIRMSFREEWPLEKLRERINEICKESKE